jgi:transcriptional regulator with XRE-family HTH domain
MRSEGSVQLVQHIARHGAAAIARRVGASASAVRAWSKGERRPGPGRREMLAEAYGIEAGSWLRRSTAGKQPTKVVETVAAPFPATDGAESDALTVCRATVARLERELDRLGADPAATARERSSVASALTASTRLLARLTGSIEITPSMILRSPHWLALRTTLMDAIEPVPGALEAWVKALEGLEG